MPTPDHHILIEMEGQTMLANPATPAGEVRRDLRKASFMDVVKAKRQLENDLVEELGQLMGAKKMNELWPMIGTLDEDANHELKWLEDEFITREECEFWIELLAWMCGDVIRHRGTVSDPQMLQIPEESLEGCVRYYQDQARFWWGVRNQALLDGHAIAAFDGLEKPERKGSGREALEVFEMYGTRIWMCRRRLGTL